MKMNLRFYIICIAAVLALVVPAVADSNSTATIHGGVYSWNTFEPLENSVVDVNSTPSQSMVAKAGLYSFKLTPGNYSITARYYQNSTLLYSGEEIVHIKDEGDYVKDLLLLPVYSEELMDSSEVSGSSSNLDESTKNSSNSGNSAVEATIDKTNISDGMNLTEKSGSDSSNVNYLLIALTLFIFVAGGHQLFRKHKKMENTLQKEKTESMAENFSMSVNTHELTEKIPNKSNELEVRQNLQTNTEKTFSLKEPVVEPEPKIIQSEPKIIVTSPTESEPKTFLTGSAAETESGIPEKKMSAESKVESVAQEKELAGPEPEERIEIISLEEPEDNPKIETPATKIEAPASPRKKFPLPADLQEIMDIIRGQGGRITQKDLRSKLKYSEGKVSLMLADLERRELIEKFKRGRGNVVILRDEER